MISRSLCSIAALFALASSPACSRCGPDMPARGTALAAWSITTAGQLTTCAQVGAASVSVLLHSRASGTDVTSVFACTDSQGLTSPVVAGPYDATLTLRTADGAAIATAPIQGPVTIVADQLTDLAPVAFAADGRGTLALSLVTLPPRLNCAPKGDGGAGVTANTIIVTRAGDGCAPLTFRRSRGSTALGIYQVNCGVPQVSDCIERDETLTVEGIDPGAYVITVTAFIGATGCWGGTEALSVPAGAALVKPIQLAPTPLPHC
jgi:hypothetical protein